MERQKLILIGVITTLVAMLWAFIDLALDLKSVDSIGVLSSFLPKAFAIIGVAMVVLGLCRPVANK
ncbi:hypothetical protein E6R41_17365 [Citrobacter freundii]|uniref:hypothetical protein n=1 Tax=Citrobacter freundii TaxID=546 RepID=UPI00109C0645|nr:hypothetical protein [Citrobacter freundii]THB07230.1 hypothetical protein E6R41_17365 [Citrobacter freundii]HBB9912968.1 hypothetical protein [Citrobacter freundii]